MRPFHTIRSNQILLLVTLAIAAVNLYLIYFVSPMVQDQEMAQKIFYYHVPLAWNAFFSYLLAAGAGGLYLAKGDTRWDRWSLAGAEIGTMFALLILITGPIWATPIWGKAWSWEPRLTSTLILFLVFMGYFMVREFGGPYEQSSRYAAVIGILGVLLIPFVVLAVTWWAPEVQNHPQMAMNKQPGAILRIFLFSLFSFTLILIYLIRYRQHIGELALSKMRSGEEP